MRKVAVLDVDGVLVDCEGGFVRVATSVLKKNLVRLNNNYDLGVRYNLTNTEVLHVFAQMDDHPEGWANLPPLPGAPEAFRRLQEYGYEIHLATAIPESRRALREASLFAHGMIPDDIHCAGHHLASKVAILDRLKPIMFVDDRLSHLHSAPHVPERVWVDHGDSQDGLVPCDQIIQVKSLASWVDAWALAKGYERKTPTPRSSLSIV